MDVCALCCSSRKHVVDLRIKRDEPASVSTRRGSDSTSSSSSSGADRVTTGHAASSSSAIPTRSVQTSTRSQVPKAKCKAAATAAASTISTTASPVPASAEHVVLSSPALPPVKFCHKRRSWIGLSMAAEIQAVSRAEAEQRGFKPCGDCTP